MKVHSYRIINQRGANGKIQVLLINGDKDTITYNPNQVGEFNAAATQLLSGKEVIYTAAIKRFITTVRGSGNEIVPGVDEFLNETI